MNRKATLWVIVVFLLGLALGGVITHIADQRVFGVSGIARPQPKQDWRPRVMKELTEELALTPEQQQQIVSILDDTRKNYDSIYEPIRPQIEQARQEGRARIRGVLTPGQIPKFEEYLKKLDERRKQAGR